MEITYRSPKNQMEPNALKSVMKKQIKYENFTIRNNKTNLLKKSSIQKAVKSH